jgi:hypothetical protein
MPKPQNHQAQDGLYQFIESQGDMFRTYYRRGETLYCFQRDNSRGSAILTGSCEISFYECTDAGEPLCVVATPADDRFDRVVMPALRASSDF